MGNDPPIGALYSAVFKAIAVSAAQDLFELTAPSNKRVIIHEFTCGQYSDPGDAQAELLSIVVTRGYTVAGSGGSAVTPAKLKQRSSRSALSTVTRNNTTVANTGTAVDLISRAWNVQAGELQIPRPGHEIEIEAGERIVFRTTAPADALTMNGTLIFEERDLRY